MQHEGKLLLLLEHGCIIDVIFFICNINHNQPHTSMSTTTTNTTITTLINSGYFKRGLKLAIVRVCESVLVLRKSAQKYFMQTNTYIIILWATTTSSEFLLAHIN